MGLGGVFGKQEEQQVEIMRLQTAPLFKEWRTEWSWYLGRAGRPGILCAYVTLHTVTDLVHALG